MDRAAPTPLEKANWQEHLSRAVNKRKFSALESVDEARKKLRSAAGAPRLASYHHGLRLDNAIRHGLHADGLVAWVPLDPDRPATDDLAADETEPGLLTSICDEEGKQWAFYRHMLGAKHAQWHQFHGQIHRRRNDWHRALSLAGVLDVWVTMLFELNIGRGPFQTRQWHLEMEDHAFDCSINMDPDHDALLFCWPAICDDHDWRDEAVTNRAARADFLLRLVADRSVRVVGGNAAFNKWWSIFNGARIDNFKGGDEAFHFAGPLYSERVGYRHRCCFSIQQSRPTASSSSSITTLTSS